MIEMTAEMADKAVKAAQAKARELNANMTVSVVDESGRLVMTVRGNGCGYFTTDTSRGKATLAAALRRSTKAMIERGPSTFIQSLPGLLPGQVLPSGGAMHWSGRMRRWNIRSGRRMRHRWCSGHW